MSHSGDYGDSIPQIKTQPKADTWQPIGAVIARLIAPEVAKRVREAQGASNGDDKS